MYNKAASDFKPMISDQTLKRISERAYSRNLQHNQGLWICVDAFPRSANTFTTYYASALIYQHMQCGGVLPSNSYEFLRSATANVIEKTFVHHLHDPEILLELVEAGIKTLSVLRAPEEAFRSVISYYGADDEETLVETLSSYSRWINVYKKCCTYKTFRLIDFNDIRLSPIVVFEALKALSILDPGTPAPEPWFAEYVKTGIVEIDRTIHKDLFSQRCAVPSISRGQADLFVDQLANSKYSLLLSEANELYSAITTLNPFYRGSTI